MTKISSRKKKSKTNDNIVTKLVELIHNHDEYNEIPMQYLLVKFGGRKAYLLETTHYSEEMVQKFLSLAKEIGLHISKDRLGLEHAPRYLIHSSPIKRLPRNDEELGALLGFKDPGGDYSDGRHPRTTLSISTNAETCSGGCQSAGTVELAKGTRQEIEQFAEKKVNSFNQVMIQLGLPYRFEYVISVKDGSLKRAEELMKMNMKYIRENKRHYISDMWNELSGDDDHPFLLLFEMVIKNKKMLSKYLPFYSYFYHLINDDDRDNKTIVKRLNKKFYEFLNEFK